MAGRREDLEIVIGADLGGLAADLAKGARLTQQFAREAGRDVGRNMPRPGDFKAPDVKGFKDISAHAGKAALDIDGTKSSLAGLALKGGAVGVGLAAAAAGAVGLGAAFRQLKESIVMAAQVEQTTLAFDVMLSSAQKAKDMVAGLRKFAAETPFNSRDVTGAGKQLLAYGVAADQIIPTLRMLGDVSAGFGQDLPLKELTYLYGTLFAQQRAYAVDIKQFAGRGVPIYEELAKVVGKSVAEVKDLVEEGRIGRDEVTKAFVSMTGAGGKFFNMTKRQADTLAGTWEQMTDAFDLAKIKFGQIVIRELGLKDSVKNLEAFGNTLERNMEKIAPTVRFLGDLAKAGGRVAYEFGKATVNAIDFVDTLQNTAFPEIRENTRRLKEDIDAVLKAGREFRIKPSDVAIVVGTVADQMANLFIDTLKGIKDIGDGLRREVLKPIGEGFQAMMGTWIEAKDLIGRGSDAERYRPPATFEADESVVKRYRALLGDLIHVQQQLAPLQPKERELGAGKVEIQPLEKPLRPDQVVLRDALLAKERELKALRESYLKAFTTPENFPFVQHKLITEGVVPSTPARGAGVVLGDDGFLSKVIARLEAAQQLMRGKTASVALDLKLKEAADEARRLAEAIKEGRRFQGAAGGFGAAMALGPYGVVVGDFIESMERAKAAQNQFASAVAAAAALGPYGGVVVPSMPQSAVRLMGDMSPSAADLRKSLREKYDPLRADGELMRKKGDLDELLKRKLITPKEHELGWRDAVKEVADRMGAGGPTRLPDAVLAGSQEDARLLSNFFAGQQRQTTDDLLMQIKTILEQIRGSNSRMAEAPPPRPVNVAPPGGG